MKASDAVAIVLAANKITYGFELIGGMIAHLVDSINQLDKTKLVSMHHEQSAAFAACAISRTTNHKEMGVALGTSGPGATNLVTGIADCWLDSHPCLFLTGQVNTNELKNDKPIRQQGFQELDIISITKSITKYAYQITDVEEIIPCLQKAIDTARKGRPGPVLIDIPMDLQRAEIDESSLDYLQLGSNKERESTLESSKINIIFDELKKSKKPLFLIGGGAVNERSFQEWLNFLTNYSLPHVASLKGCEKTILSDYFFGLIGAYGTRTANFAIQNCDLLVVVGSRMDVRQTGANSDSFAKEAKIIQIDIDEGQLNNRVSCDHIINLDCESFFNNILKLKINIQQDWRAWCDSLTEHYSKTFVDEYTNWEISPFELMTRLNQCFENMTIHYVADVGNNQMWAAHTIKLWKGQTIHHSGGLGSMGFAIPSAIGAYYATQSPIVVITGDGGAQLNIQELDIIAREKLPILIIVMNNYSLGMIDSFQRMYFDGRNSSAYWNGYSSHYQKIGEAYNIESHTVNNTSIFSTLLANFKLEPKPCLLEIIMPDARECRPRLEFGNPIDQQSPKLNT